MSWDPNSLDKLDIKQDFRLRGENMTRMEVFSDAAFAFALTMLVVSVGTIPQDYPEFIAALKNIPAFALSFLQLAVFWLAHRTWSNRYGLNDTLSSLLTLIMIFFILVFVYPLRLIFSAFFDFVSIGWLPSDFKVNTVQELSSLFIVYGLGFAILALIVMLLYWHAFRVNNLLKLNELEKLHTSFAINIWGIQAVFGFASALFAWLAPAFLQPYAGFVYFGLAVAIPCLSYNFAKRKKQLSQL
ncbi:DUF1211 domain-containing protein [Paraglaciecola aquimarina]|uniref:DUF1211 domain-containing protein n=1 Tax=Paraglaciecola algarum TaxID=3050085 RepID=A0ABS9DB48_9ALTE|nr:DUF1211 domain-containing protein [Paraglaciecola sp. G1-23]MCF2950076.1 DUF1211 domain-containing protein [Paraglaciecola sp. G1-23]